MKRFSPLLFSPFLDIRKKTLSHGGNLLSVIRKNQKNNANDAHECERNNSWIDLSSAVNRHPWPTPNVPDSLWHELPDSNELITAANHYYGASNFVPVAGTQQAIEALPTLLQPKAELGSKAPIVMVPNIGYQEHRLAWEKWGYDVQDYDLPNHKKKQHAEAADDALINNLLTHPWHILILIQPNNPSTHCFTKGDIESLIHIAEKRQAYIIIDEAFIDPQIDGSTLTLISQRIKNYNQDWPESLIILKSVGKFFGLPGARVGFSFAAPTVLHKVSLVIGPWPISTPAVWLVTQALKDTVWQDNARVDLLQRKQRFTTELLPLFQQVFDKFIASSSDADSNDCSQQWHESHLFFTVMSKYSKRVFTQLKNIKIHTRLGEGWLRFALPSDIEFDVIKRRLKNELHLNQKKPCLVAEKTSEEIQKAEEQEMKDQEIKK